MTLSKRVVAVVTAFNPGLSLKECVEVSLQQCGRVIVVDNTPGGRRNAHDVLAGVPGVEIIQNSRNLGLADAMNLGIGIATDAEYLFLLDQDSVPQSPMVDRLIDILDSHPDAAIASPAPWDASAQRFIDPRTRRRQSLSEMSVVITSAMLLRKVAFDETLGMRSDFFVDCVDQDFCLQIRRRGWKILQDKTTLLPHSLGETRWHGIGPFKIRATYHPTWRLYWVCRNGVILSRESFFMDTKWSLINLVFMTYWFVTVLLFESPRPKRLATMIRGVIDGIFSRRDLAFIPAGANS